MLFLIRMSIRGRLLNPKGLHSLFRTPKQLKQAAITCFAIS
jgi:hypothetical protein